MSDNDRYVKPSTRNNVVPFSKEVEDFHFDLINSEEIKPKIQPWMWLGVIPLCTCTLFVGEGGIGKSLLLLDLAAKISKGEQLKVGGETVDLPQGKVIILTAEDDFEYQLKPKLLAAEADCKQIEVLRCMISQTNGKKKFIDLDKYLFLLEERINILENVKLIIIDPVSYFTGELKDHINIHVANFLSHLNDLAKKYNLAIILNKHFRKQTGGSNITHAMSEVAGGGAWVNTPRASWAIGRHPEDKQKICIVDLKSNLRKKIEEAYAYKIVPAVIHFEGQPMESIKVEWSSEMISITADEVMNKENFEKSKLKSAYELVIKHLTDNGQTVQKTLKEVCLRKGISSRTFDDAVKMIKKDEIVKIENGVGGNKLWTLL